MTVPLFTKELLVTGLKRSPIIGPVVEVLDGFQKSKELLSYQNRMNMLEAALPVSEKRMRDYFASEITKVVTDIHGLKTSSSDIQSRISKLSELKEQGWTVGLFQGLFLGSNYYKEFLERPQEFGKVLKGSELIDPKKFQIVCGDNSNYIVELPPSILHTLLESTKDTNTPIKIQRHEDVWVLPSNETSAPRPPAIFEKADFNKLFAVKRNSEVNPVINIKVQGRDNLLIISESEQPMRKQEIIEISGKSSFNHINLPKETRIALYCEGTNNKIYIRQFKAKVVFTGGMDNKVITDNLDSVVVKERFNLSNIVLLKPSRSITLSY